MIDFKKSIMIWNEEERTWMEFFFTDTVKLFAETFILEKALPIIEKKADEHLEKMNQINETMESLIETNEFDKFYELKAKFNKENIKIIKYHNLLKKYYKNYKLLMAWYKEAERRI